MSNVCAICGRDFGCWRGSSEQGTLNCYQIGYEREKERAEAAAAKYADLTKAWTEQAKDDKAAQERLVAQLQAADEAASKAEQYKADWYAAKTEFGTAMGKQRALTRAAEARVATLEDEIVTLQQKDLELRAVLAEVMNRCGLCEGIVAASMTAMDGAAPCRNCGRPVRHVGINEYECPCADVPMVTP